MGEPLRFNRRAFLGRSGAVLAAGAIGVPIGFQRFAARNHKTGSAIGYGPLAPGPDLRDGVARLALPPGFSYRSFGLAGAKMSDGNLTPLGPDGMASFSLPNGNVRLVRNHEDRNPPGVSSAAVPLGARYDRLGSGGTSSLEVDPVSRQLVRDFVSLSGTTTNCSGGATPWGSWLTCEEIAEGPSEGWLRPHGYVYEVPALQETYVSASPIAAMGRFIHEAVAIDPQSGFAYMTEDNGGTSGFYRFLPSTPGRLSEGRLQMLTMKGVRNYATASGQETGHSLQAGWVDIRDPDPVVFEARSVFNQGYAQGAASFSRLEGCFFGDGSVFFNSTNGGDAGLGQVWQYTPQGQSGGQLTLLFESTDPEILDSPDHICLTPRGGIVLCEDNRGNQHLRGLTQQGQIFDLARNILNESEWAGATFSPDGQTLFANLLGPTTGPNPPADPGMTIAIWGPWTQGPL